MTITIVIINPQTGNGLECWWHHALRRWAENLEDFEKWFSWVQTMVFKRWVPTMMLRSWGSDYDVEKLGARPWCWEIEIGPRNVPSVGVFVVSIVWYKRLLRIFSLLVLKKWSQKSIIVFVLEQRRCLCIWVRLHLYYGYITWVFPRKNMSRILIRYATLVLFYSIRLILLC